MNITPIIGLEVHIELKTKSKMFCGCDASHFHSAPNSHTCPVCLGLPGALPVPNRVAIEWCLKLGLALGCRVNRQSFFERKNYFYPDLAKGYQISQYQRPFTVDGYIDVSDQRIGINRAHLEEDTGKSVHLSLAGEDITLIDYNRAGVPLVEVVSEPDISSSLIAKEYLNKIQQIVRYLGISDADIEKGSMRCEPTVNLKIENDGQTFFTPLVEIKNIASLSGVQSAIEYEVNRQLNQWRQTGEVKSATNKTTRGWDAVKNQTFLQREKEGSADYRYFPEPDIPPFEFTDDQIDKICRTLPELPNQKISRYQSDYSLGTYDSRTLADDYLIAAAFEKAVGKQNSPEFAKFTANLFLGPIKTRLNETQEDVDLAKIQPQFFLNLFQAVKNNQLSSSVAKQVIIDSYLSGVDPVIIAQDKGLVQVSDLSALTDLAKQVISSNPKAVDDYKKNPNSIGFLVGQLMKLSHGSANPPKAREILEELLK